MAKIMLDIRHKWGKLGGEFKWLRLYHHTIIEYH